MFDWNISNKNKSPSSTFCEDKFSQIEKFAGKTIPGILILFWLKSCVTWLLLLWLELTGAGACTTVTGMLRRRHRSVDWERKERPGTPPATITSTYTVYREKEPRGNLISSCVIKSIYSSNNKNNPEKIFRTRQSCKKRMFFSFKLRTGSRMILCFVFESFISF